MTGRLAHVFKQLKGRDCCPSNQVCADIERLLFETVLDGSIRDATKQTVCFHFQIFSSVVNRKLSAQRLRPAEGCV